MDVAAAMSDVREAHACPGLLVVIYAVISALIVLLDILGALER